MKDQIRYIRYMNGETYFRFENRPGEQRTAVLFRKIDDSERSFPVEESIHDRILTEVSEMLTASPDLPFPEPPAVSEVILADKSRHALPQDELYRLLEDAWIDGDYILRQITGPQLMGLVAAPTFPAPGSPMTGFMGILQTDGAPENASVPSSPRYAVWTDDTHWECTCGQSGCTGKFCPNCGQSAPSKTWDCPNCGARGLKSRFCPECGTPRPEAGEPRR